MQKVKMKNYYKNKRFKDKMILGDLSCVSIWCFVLIFFFKKVVGVKQLKKDWCKYLLIVFKWMGHIWLLSHWQGSKSFFEIKIAGSSLKYRPVKKEKYRLKDTKNKRIEYIRVKGSNFLTLLGFDSQSISALLSF